MRSLGIALERISTGLPQPTAQAPGDDITLQPIPVGMT
jgi:hypothetical protein